MLLDGLAKRKIIYRGIPATPRSIKIL